ncbi:MAG: electron transfer flavoprotein subunit alpha/FixB family protein [Acidimicrobiia bacterium]
MLLVFVEHDRGTPADAAREALTASRSLAEALGVPLHAVTVGEVADGLAREVADYGAVVVHQAHHRLLSDYGPDAWAESVAQVALAEGAQVIVGTGTDRGNEVLAHVAALMDQPFAANCLEVVPGKEWELTRARWGGSLLESATLDAAIRILTFAHHAVDPVSSPAAGEPRLFEPELDDAVAQTLVTDRVVLTTGVTLATAPVVVSGGRGVGSAEGFAPLEELASLLGGVVGCSRVVTNNGWRPHSDQVGQTGTRIAPELYIACGISGAIQHWVGAMASKRILAINTDAEANMVIKADYAIIGDLSTVIPAIVEAVKVAQSGQPS